MSSSFSAATRQLDDGYERKAFSVSAVRAHGDNFDFGVEPTEYDRKGVVVVDRLHGNAEMPDRYSYRPTRSSSTFPIPTNTRRSGNTNQYTNGSNRLYKDTFDGGRRSNEAFEWENNPHDNPGEKSSVSKSRPSYGSYHDSEYIRDSHTHRSTGSSRYEVQPGFQRVQYESSNGKARNQPTMIEVSPGEHLRLRGADETWRAIHHDFFVPCSCVLCGSMLFCIQDAVFVLCPDCLIVSPLEGVVYDGYDGGVGMGFTMESLATWQEEIRNLNQGERNW